MQNKPQRHGDTEKIICYNEELTDKIIASAIEVHRHLGPGLLESAYEECFCHELNIQGIPFERQNHNDNRRVKRAWESTGFTAL